MGPLVASAVAEGLRERQSLPANSVSRLSLSCSDAPGEGCPRRRSDCLSEGPGQEDRSARQSRSEEHTSELQSPCNLVCRLLLEKKKNTVHAACSVPNNNDIHHFSILLACKLTSQRLHVLFQAALMFQFPPVIPLSADLPSSPKR